ncbi:hypothetical protein HAX54_043374, partial [Datura stramonium]|nr:hypothetical protein [Datura stramonium]
MVYWIVSGFSRVAIDFLFSPSHIVPSFQATKDLFHERDFVMQDIEEKALKFHALLQGFRWGPLVEDPGE